MANYNIPQPGVGAVGQYQISARPYCTSSIEVPAAGSTPLEIAFPAVTSWIWVKNLDEAVPIRMGFSALGVTGALAAAGGSNCYVHIGPAGTDFDGSGGASTFQVRCRAIYLISETSDAVTDVSIMAGLTGIDNNLSASAGYNFSGSAGVG